MVTILSDNYYLSFVAATQLHMWTVSWVGYVNTLNKFPVRCNQKQDIMVLHMRLDNVAEHNTMCRKRLCKPQECTKWPKIACNYEPTKQTDWVRENPRMFSIRILLRLDEAFSMVHVLLDLLQLDECSSFFSPLWKSCFACHQLCTEFNQICPPPLMILNFQKIIVFDCKAN
jgi:hypothetical protein